MCSLFLYYEIVLVVVWMLLLSMFVLGFGIISSEKYYGPTVEQGFSSTGKHGRVTCHSCEVRGFFYCIA
jgi:hypothetical protein